MRKKLRVSREEDILYTSKESQMIDVKTGITFRRR